MEGATARVGVFGGEARPAYAGPAEESTGSDLAQERERILNALLGGATLGGGVVVALLLLGPLQRPSRLLGFALLLAGYALVTVAFVLRRIPTGWRIAVLIGASYAAALYSMLLEGLTGTGPWYLLGIPILLFVLAGERWGVVSGTVNALIYLAFVAAYRLGWPVTERAVAVGQSLTRPVILGVSFAFISTVIVVVHSLFARAQRRARRFLRQQGDALRAAQAVSAERQQRLERANADLRRQEPHSELATEIGRVAAMGLHLDDLAARAVELIRQSIQADYVGLFLLDEDRAYAQLRARAGALQAPSLGLDEHTRVTDDMLLRQCVSSGRPQVVLGVDHVRNLTGRTAGSPFLHWDIQSALALPLIARGSVFGAISVQSRAPAAFHNGDIVSLRIIADQVSSAISNAELAQELRERLEQLERMQQYYVREAWEQFLVESAATTYEYHRPEVKPLGHGPLPEVERVLAHPRLVMLGGGDASAPSALLVPIALREQVLGVLGLHRLDADQPWTEEQKELLAAVSEQMGLIIENSRLFAEARSRAARERRARQIVAHLRQSLDVEEVLATAAQEMGDALQLQDVTIRLTRTEEPIGE
jgi:GAF domain-containing protein